MTRSKKLREIQNAASKYSLLDRNWKYYSRGSYGRSAVVIQFIFV
jgi:hypothetical protein